MTVRRMTTDDLPWLHDLAVQFNDKYVGVPLNYTKTSAMLTHMINTGVALRSDNGAIVGIIMDDPFRDTTFLVEIGWYADDGTGMKLLDAFIEEGRQAGVDQVRMTTLHSNRGAEVCMRRRRFTPLEHSWGLTIGEVHGTNDTSGSRSRN